MDPTEVLKAITDIAEALRADVAKIGEKCDSVVTEMAALKADRAKRKDNDNDDDAMARRTAADSIDPAAFAALSASVAEMRKRQSRPTADLKRVRR
jgi:hypothetical protein